MVKLVEIAESLKKCLTLETGLEEITFNSIIDYLILVIYVLRKLDVTKTECKKQIKRFEDIIEKDRQQLPYPIFSRIIYTGTNHKIQKLRDYCTG